MTGQTRLPTAVGPVEGDPVHPYPPGLLAEEPVALVDLLDRVLAKGVVLTGEVTLSIADIDLVHVSLRALISAVRPDLYGLPRPPTGPTPADPWSDHDHL